MLLAVASAGLAAYVYVYAARLAELPIRSDGFSYYVYLPSWFLFGDPSLNAVARDCCAGEFPDYSAIVRWPGTRRWVNAHPIGVAIMQAPFFVVAHVLTKWTNLSPHGFSFYYQHAAGLSGLFWMLAGVAVLRRFLLRHFTDGVTAATLIVLLFGTNLFHYGTFDSSYSHTYAFVLLAALLLLIERWHESPSRSTSLLLGITAGLIVLVRHTNVLFLLMLPLYGMPRPWAPASKLAWLLRERRAELFLIAAVAAGVAVPQLAIYYQATGRPVVSSYGALGFTFAAPHIFGVLLSPQKGLFFWSPILLLALAGLALARGDVRRFVLPSIIVLAVDTYLIASWWDWQFGGSYGHRAFVDLLPLFALGLASFFRWAADQRVRLAAASLLCAAFAALSTFQMLQYWHGIIPFNDTTWAQYRELFLTWR